MNDKEKCRDSARQTLLFLYFLSVNYIDSLRQLVDRSGHTNALKIINHRDF